MHAVRRLVYVWLEMMIVVVVVVISHQQNRKEGLALVAVQIFVVYDFLAVVSVDYVLLFLVFLVVVVGVVVLHDDVDDVFHISYSYYSFVPETRQQPQTQSQKRQGSHGPDSFYPTQVGDHGIADVRSDTIAVVAATPRSPSASTADATAIAAVAHAEPVSDPLPLPLALSATA